MFITQFLNQNTRKVSSLVDLRFAEAVSRKGVLTPYMPIVNYPDRELLILKFNTLPTIAYLVAEDAEIPYGKQKTVLTEKFLGNLKLAKARGYTGKDFEAFHKFQTLMSAAGPAARGASTALADYFMAQPATLVDQIVDLHTVLQLKVYCTGSCTYTDPLTGVKAELDYTSEIPAGQMPAALTGTARWSQSTTATPIKNLRDHARTFFQKNRFYPKQVGMSTDTLWQLQEADSTKQETAQLRGIVIQGTDTASLAAISPPTLEELNRILTMRIGSEMEIVVLDECYNVESKDGTITENVPFLPPDYYVFLTPGMGERALVPTIEKDFAPGVYTESKVLETAPRRERTLAIANGIPFVKDARLLAARNVNNTAVA